MTWDDPLLALVAREIGGSNRGGSRRQGHTSVRGCSRDAQPSVFSGGLLGAGAVHHHSVSCDRPDGAHGHGQGGDGLVGIHCFTDHVIEHPRLLELGISHLVARACWPSNQKSTGIAVIMHGQLGFGSGDGCIDDGTPFSIPKYYTSLQYELAAVGVETLRINTPSAGSADAYVGVVRMLIEGGRPASRIMLLGSSQAGEQAIIAATQLAASPVGLVVCWAPADVSHAAFPSSTRLVVLGGTHDGDVQLAGSYGAFSRTFTHASRAFVAFRGFPHSAFQPGGGAGVVLGPYANSTYATGDIRGPVVRAVTIAAVEEWLLGEPGRFSDMLFDGVSPTPDAALTALAPQFAFRSAHELAPGRRFDVFSPDALNAAPVEGVPPQFMLVSAFSRVARGELQALTSGEQLADVPICMDPDRDSHPMGERIVPGMKGVRMEWSSGLAELRCSVSQVLSTQQISVDQCYLCFDVALVVNASMNIEFETTQGAFADWVVSAALEVNGAMHLAWIDRVVPNHERYPCALATEGLADLRTSLFSTVAIRLSDLLNGGDWSQVAGLRLRLGAGGRVQGVANVGRICVTWRA